MGRTKGDRVELTEEQWLSAYEATPSEVLEQTEITHYLDTYVGDRKRVFAILAACPDPDARKLMATFREVQGAWHDGPGREGRHAWLVSYEALATIAKVPTTRMLELVLRDAVLGASMKVRGKFEEVVDNMLVSSALPGPEGFKDREILAKHVGFTPVPKNNVTNIFGGAQIDARKQELNVAVLPQVEDGVRRMSDRFNATLAPKELPAAPVIDDDGSDG